MNGRHVRSDAGPTEPGGPGTLIRRQTFKRERQRGAKGNRAGHKGELIAGCVSGSFDPEGPKNPEGEQRFKHQVKLLDQESGNGFVVWNSPQPGRTGPRGRSGRPNGFEAKFGRAAKGQARSFNLPTGARQREVVGRE
jgi:hypothetical protein